MSGRRDRRGRKGRAFLLGGAFPSDGGPVFPTRPRFRIPLAGVDQFAGVDRVAQVARSGIAALTVGLLAGFLASCAGSAPPTPEPGTRPTVESFPLPDATDAEGRAWIDETLQGMTLREEAAQLVFPWISGAYASPTSPEFQDLLDQIELGIGGVLISIGLPHSYAAKLNELQRHARVPLLVSSDFEQGGPGMRLAHIFALPSLLDQGGGTSFPPTMAFGAIGEERFARELGRITALEARAVGVHLNFAPVLDVNSNPRNPVINTRSFGEDPVEVGRLGAAFIRGSGEGGVLTTAKHFPGHGDTETDSHIALPAVPANRARLDTLELVPFRYAMDAGVDAVMTAHVVVPGVLGPDSPPATLSSYFLTDLLREEMGFDGLVLTDALRMGAIAQGWGGGGEASVRALEAGSDVLLAPADVRESLDAVVQAVESGRLSRERIRESVRRILELKARMGLHEGRTVDLEAVDHIVGAGPHLEFADSAATRSITLVRDVEHRVPLLPDSVERVLSVTWTRPGDLIGSRTADRLLADRFDGLRAVGLSAADGAAALDALWNSAWEADRILVNSFIAYQAGTGIIGVEEDFARFVRRLAVHRPVVATSFGNPYALDAFPEVGSYLLAWGGRDVSQRAAVRALTGEARISGTLPISLPPYHFEGEGLVREQTVEPRIDGPGDPLDETGFVAGRDEPGRDLPRDSVGPEAPAAVDSAAADAPVSPGAAVGDDPPSPPLPSMTVSRAEAPASDAGMSEAVLARLDSALLGAVVDSATPGAVLAVGRGDQLIRLRGYGRTDWAPDAPPATPTTLYDLASLTKVVATTTALMRLVDEGRFSLDDRVVEHLPWWAGPDSRKAEVTLRQLLLHRAGLPEYEPLYTEARGRADYERALGALELEFEPGTRSRYSDLGMMTLGFVVEEVTGLPLGQHVNATVWSPLGMSDTGFLPEEWLLPRIAPTEVDTMLRNTHLHGVVHDENAWALGGRAGHAGVFSTAADLAVYARMMLAGGELEPCFRPPAESGTPAGTVSCTVPWAEGGRVLSEEVVAEFTRRWNDTSSRALGWDTPSGRSSAGDFFTAAAFGHTGFTGTSIWIDPELDLFVVLLTNRVNPTRENQEHVELRRTVHDLAARAITDRTVEPRR